MTTQPLIKTSFKTPLYFGLITLCSAIASATVVWAGFVSFGLSVLVFELIGHWIVRH